MAQKGRGAVVSDASWCTGPRTAAVRTLTNKQTNMIIQLGSAHAWMEGRIFFRVFTLSFSVAECRCTCTH